MAHGGKEFPLCNFKSLFIAWNAGGREKARVQEQGGQAQTDAEGQTGSGPRRFIVPMSSLGSMTLISRLSLARKTKKPCLSVGCLRA